ncbi:MAG: S41 family peptidase [Candidatus Hydrogenedentota bacterium]
MRNTRSQFVGLLCFLLFLGLLLSNGFVNRIFAQQSDVDVFTQIEPIGNVLDEILKSYVYEPDLNTVVEGGLKGMMNALDEHSSYISPEIYKELTDETQGEFEGIGVTIQLDENGNIMVFQPIEGSPAAKAGVHANDRIIRIDGVSAKGMSLAEAAQLIKGPRGTVVKLTVLRPAVEEGAENEIIEIDIKRGKIPLESIVEARVLDEGIGYVRLSDFKRTTQDELRKCLKELDDQGMKSLILDLRWNPGGLLDASVDVCSLFLESNKLVTYTKERELDTGQLTEDMMLYTKGGAAEPMSFPLIVLVNQFTASSSEIVTGALQFYERAIIVGQQTFGKGSVQTIIPLRRPAGSALRLTTALYYTPAEVTIHKQGILPDVEVKMSESHQRDLLTQMRESFMDDPSLRRGGQNHGSVTGNEVTEETVEDIQLKRAVEILKEDPVFENLVRKYHRDTTETQVAAAEAADTDAGEEQPKKDQAEAVMDADIDLPPVEN